MIEQVSTPMVAIGFFQDSTGTGVAGLTVTFDIDRIVNNAGTPTITNIVTGGSATGLGKGFYGAPISAANNSVEGEYVVLFKTTDTSVQAKQIPSLWCVQVGGIENLDLAISAIDLDVWDQPVPGAFAAGTAGYILGNNLDVPVSGAVGGDEITVIADGITLRPYGAIESVALGAGVETINAPSLATAVMLQANTNDVYFTNDESTPTSTHGFLIDGGETGRMYSLKPNTHDVLKFQRSAATNLVYQFYRPA